MKKTIFISLDDLNKFLEFKNFPPLTEDIIEQGLINSITFDPNNLDESNVSGSLKNDNDRYNAAVEFSLNQIDMLTRQRDEAYAEAEEEYRSHMECHDKFKDVLCKTRIQGYAEAIIDNS